MDKEGPILNATTADLLILRHIVNYIEKNCLDLHMITVTPFLTGHNNRTLIFHSKTTIKMYAL